MTTTRKMTPAAYRNLLLAEFGRLTRIAGRDSTAAIAALGPRTKLSIDTLKARNTQLRTELRGRGYDLRPRDEQTAELTRLNQIIATRPSGGLVVRTAAEIDALSDRDLSQLVWSLPRTMQAAGINPATTVQQTPAERQHLAQLDEQRRMGDRDTTEDNRIVTALAVGERASAAQISEILDLIRQGAHREPGFMRGPTDRAGIAALSHEDADTYIASLTGN